MIEHKVFIDSMGGAVVLSCEALNMKNVEYGYRELSAEGIKKRILKYKFISEENADFDLLIVDNRPEPEDFNKKREEESKLFKKDRNSMETPRR